jgi:DNA-binding Lrp family transcriptional regulator
MTILPAKVKERLLKLRAEYPPYIIIRKLNGKYYVYRDVHPWDREAKKQLTVSEYMGRIDEDGVFTKKRQSRLDELEHAKEVIASRGGKILMPELKEDGQPASEVLTSDERERKILTILSMNGKASSKLVGKLAGVPATTAYGMVKRIEKKYGIRYVPEIDFQKLGYLSYITFVKFLENKVPSTEEIREVLEQEPLIQMVLLTKGDHDLIIRILAKDNRELYTLLVKLQSNSFFKYYNCKWSTSPSFDTSGLIPIRDRFFEMLWNERSESAEEGEKKRMLPRRELLVLRELNGDGSMEFSEIEKKHSLDKGAAQYAFHSLVKKGIIKRITINERKTSVKYSVMILTEIFNGGKAEQSRPKLLLDIIENTESPVNKYVFTSNIEVPRGGMLILPVFKENALGANVDHIKKNLGGVDVVTYMITDVLVGEFCYRKFDNTYGSQYRALTTDYKVLKPQDKIDYEK